MVDALAAWSSRHGRTPARSEWPRVSGELPSLSVIEIRFGGFGAAVREAGLAPAERARWTGGDRRRVREWTEWYGRPPSKKDWDPHRARTNGQAWRAERFNRGEWPPERTVRLAFGGWTAALEAVAHAR